MKSEYYNESVELGKRFQKENKNWAGFDVIKYHLQIKDLVIRYGAKTMLDYGCGKGSQYIEPLPYHSEEIRQTLDEWLGVTVYKYDPCVEEFSIPPPPGSKFDGVICTQVLGSIPDADLSWVSKDLESYTDKFCFISLNFQRPSKGKKMLYDPEYFKLPRTRDFFKSYFKDWQGNNLFWWWKDRTHYTEWMDDQLNKTWKDIPDVFEGKYSFVETIYG